MPRELVSEVLISGARCQILQSGDYHIIDSPFSAFEIPACVVPLQPVCPDSCKETQDQNGPEQPAGSDPQWKAGVSSIFLPGLCRHLKTQLFLKPAKFQAYWAPSHSLEIAHASIPLLFLLAIKFDQTDMLLQHFQDEVSVLREVLSLPQANEN